MQKKAFIASLLMVAVLLGASISHAQPPAQPAFGFPVITGQELKKELDSKAKVLVVDVRTAEEYAEAHIPKSINIPPDQYPAIAGFLPKDKNYPIVFYCRGYSWSLSNSAAVSAAYAGYKNLRLFRGGMPEWLERGYPTESRKAGKK